MVLVYEHFLVCTRHHAKWLYTVLLILIALGGRDYYYLQFMGEESEIQLNWVTFTMSDGYYVEKPEYEPRTAGKAYFTKGLKDFKLQAER